MALDLLCTGGSSPPNPASASVLEAIRYQLWLAQSPLTAKQINEVVKFRRCVLLAALTALVDAGAATVTGRGRRGSPFLYAVASSAGIESIQFPMWGDTHV